MTVTNFNDLRDWFKFGFEKGVKTSEEGRETTSPYWTLYAVGMGGADKVLAFNDRLTGMDESYKALADSIRIMNNPAGSMFRVFQTYRPRANNPTQEVRVQIFENNTVTANPQPGIGSLPVGYVEESKIQSLMAAEREKWELNKRLEDLEAQLAAPKDWSDSFISGLERIGQTQMGALILPMLAAKIMGVQIPELPKSVNGTQTTDSEAGPDEEDLEQELDELEQMAKANGMTLKDFLAKTVNLAKAQPGVVSMLAQQ